MKFTTLKYLLFWFLIIIKPAYAQQNKNIDDNNFLYYYNSQLETIEGEIAVEEAEYNSTLNKALLYSLNKKKAKRELLNVYGSRFAKKNSPDLSGVAAFSKMQALLNKQKELEQKYEIKINFEADQETLEELKSLGITLGKTISKNETNPKNRIINVIIHYFKNNFTINYKASLSAPLASELFSTEEIEKTFSFTDSQTNNTLFTTDFTFYLETKISSLNLILNPSNIQELEKLKNSDNSFTFITSAGVPYTLPAANLKNVKFFFNDKFTLATDGMKFVADGALQGFTYEGESSHIACYSKSPPYNFSGYYKDISNSLDCAGEKRIDSLSKKCSQKDCVIVATTCIENGVLKFDIKKVPLTNNKWPKNNNLGSGPYLATLPVNYAVSGKTAQIKDYLFTTSYSTDAKRFIDSLNLCDQEYIPQAITVANIIHNYPIVVSQCYGLDRLISDLNVKTYLLSAANNVSPNGTGLQQYKQKVINLMNRAKELQDGAYNSTTSDKTCSQLTTFSEVKTFVNNTDNHCTLNFISNIERIRLLKILLSEIGIGGQEAIVNLFKTINVEISDNNTISFFNALTDPANNIKGNSLITRIFSKLTLGDYTDLNRVLCLKLTQKQSLINNAFPKNDNDLFNATLYFDQTTLSPNPPIGTHQYTIDLLPDGTVDIKKKYVSDGYSAQVNIGESTELRFYSTWTTASATLSPFTLISMVNRSGLSSLAEMDNDKSIITGPAVFLKYAKDQQFKSDALQVAAVVVDIATIASGPGAIFKAYKAGKIALALYEGAQVVGSLANLSANGLSPDSELKKWIDDFNMVVVAWGGAKTLGAVYKADYVSFAKKNPFNGLNKQSVQNLINKHSSLKSSLKNHVNDVNTSKQIDQFVEYLRKLVKADAAGSVLRKIDDFIPSSGTQLIGNINKTTTLLGRWIPDMQTIKGKILPNEFNIGTEFGNLASNNGGFNFLNIPDNLANASADFFNQYNKPWLLKAIQREDDIVLATRPINKADFITATGQLKGMYAEELKFLVQQNYKPINLTVTEWNTVKTWFP